MRVTYDGNGWICPRCNRYLELCDCPAPDPLLLQPDLYGGPGQTVGEQGYLFDCGRAERKPAREQPRADQPEMF